MGSLPHILVKYRTAEFCGIKYEETCKKWQYLGKLNFSYFFYCFPNIFVPFLKIPFSNNSTSF